MTIVYLMLISISIVNIKYIKLATHVQMLCITFNEEEIHAFYKKRLL